MSTRKRSRRSLPRRRRSVKRRELSITEMESTVKSTTTLEGNSVEEATARAAEEEEECLILSN